MKITSKPGKGQPNAISVLDSYCISSGVTDCQSFIRLYRGYWIDGPNIYGPYYSVSDTDNPANWYPTKREAWRRPILTAGRSGPLWHNFEQGGGGEV